MSIVQSEGFDLITTSADLRARNFPFAEGVLAATASKFGGQAWDLGSSSATVLNYYLGLVSDNQYVGVSMWRKFENEPSAGTYVLFISDGLPLTSVPTITSSHMSLIVRAGNLLEVTGGHGALLASLPGAIVPGSWQHYEFRVFVDNSVGTVELWIDGIKVVDLTSQDTRDSGGSATLYFNGNLGSVNSYIDDIVIQQDPSVPAVRTGGT